MQPFDSITVTYGWKQGADGVVLRKPDPMTHCHKIKWKPGAMKQWGKEEKNGNDKLYIVLCPN